MIFSCLRIFSTLAMAFVLSSTCLGGPVSSFDDIEFWVGSESNDNEAAFLLDWDGESSDDQSLVWGYRWNGAATVEDMLRDVLAADTRLFAKISASGPAGIALFGAGYDLNDDCEFEISDGTKFGADGIVISGPADLAVSSNLGDLYAEGWFLGFWLLGQSSSNPFDGGSWAPSATGLSGVNLVDGHWTSLAFTTNTFSSTAFAQNPVAAVFPVPSADFDTDNDVDGHDFLAWQRGFGIEMGVTHGQGDANRDCLVDGVDLDIWSSSFGSATTGGALQSIVVTVPEPRSVVLFFVFLCLLLNRIFLRKVIVS